MPLCLFPCASVSLCVCATAGHARTRKFTIRASGHEEITYAQCAHAELMYARTQSTNTGAFPENACDLAQPPDVYSDDACAGVIAPILPPPDKLPLPLILLHFPTALPHPASPSNRCAPVSLPLTHVHVSLRIRVEHRRVSGGGPRQWRCSMRPPRTGCSPTPSCSPLPCRLPATTADRSYSVLFHNQVSSCIVYGSIIVLYIWMSPCARGTCCPPLRGLCVCRPGAVCPILCQESCARCTPCPVAIHHTPRIKSLRPGNGIN
jgi:hypothetical protein